MRQHINLAAAFLSSDDKLDWDSDLPPSEVHTSISEDRLIIRPSVEDSSGLNFLKFDVNDSSATTTIVVASNVMIEGVNLKDQALQVGGLMLQTSSSQRLSISCGVNAFGGVSIITSVYQNNDDEEDEDLSLAADEAFTDWLSKGFTSTPSLSVSPSVSVSGGERDSGMQQPTIITASSSSAWPISMSNLSSVEGTLLPPPPQPPIRGSGGNSASSVGVPSSDIGVVRSINDGDDVRGSVAASLKIEFNCSTGAVIFSGREVRREKVRVGANDDDDVVNANADDDDDGFIILRKLHVKLKKRLSTAPTTTIPSTTSSSSSSSSPFPTATMSERATPITTLKPTLFKIHKNEEGTFTMSMNKKDQVTTAAAAAVLPATPTVKVEACKVGVFAINGSMNLKMSASYTKFELAS
jgi:hypothetical protein